MNAASHKVQTTYLTLLLCNTLAASLIWGINTLFLLDAGLSNLEAFAANAFFTAGMVLFEVPTGVIADLKGRRLSFLLGTITLAVSTALYVFLWSIEAPFMAWAAVSVFLGLGFTFFSGAVEAWLVDAMTATGYSGKMEAVFGKGQIVTGVGMLVGTVAGGFIAQATNLGVPYVLRVIILLVTFGLAFWLMRDLGFTPMRGRHPIKQIKNIVNNSVTYGLRNPPIRWIMLSAPFVSGVSVYGFYALQPYLLELWGDPQAYGIAGVAVAISAGAQITGGLLVSHIGRFFARRTSVLLVGTVVGVLAITCMGLFANFWVVVGLMVVWGLVFAATMPVRQTYLNGLIPTGQRATVLSFDALLGSSGGVIAQPVLGKAADAWSYPASYLLGGVIYALAFPFAWLARRAGNHPDARKADQIRNNEATAPN